VLHREGSTPCPGMAVWPAISRPDRLGLSEIDRLDVRAGDDDARERAGRARCTAERPFIYALMTFDVNSTSHTHEEATGAKTHHHARGAGAQRCARRAGAGG